jgi:hypothetical protein
MERTAEHQRLDECRDRGAPWRRWGPYLSERQWGTVREDYSAGGDAWNYFSHDQARSRAYRWGEDGLAGISDDRQILCFAVALWNGHDPILKERLFGLTNSEGNHGEDVKEYYFYLDSTPTHSHMRYLYKYPQQAFPYERLVSENRQRGRGDFEFELLDTGVFDQDRYSDVFVEYAKADPEDVLIRLTVCNRGPDAAELHVLPTLWFRNTWSWPDGTPKPTLRASGGDRRDGVLVEARHDELGQATLLCERADLPVLVVENETNESRVFGRAGGTPYPKDGINDYVVRGRREAVNPGMTGTKAAALWQVTVPAEGEAVLRLRLRARGGGGADAFGPDFDRIFAARRADADAFYGAVMPASFTEDEARVYRQALAGMLWSKQYYLYDVRRWTRERGGSAPRNGDWSHMYNADVFSMPDKWEYPRRGVRPGVPLPRQRLAVPPRAAGAPRAGGAGPGLGDPQRPARPRMGLGGAAHPRHHRPGDRRDDLGQRHQRRAADLRRRRARRGGLQPGLHRARLHGGVRRAVRAVVHAPALRVRKAARAARRRLGEAASILSPAPAGVSRAPSLRPPSALPQRRARHRSAAASSHRLDRDRQRFLVDQVHPIADAQPADEGLDLGLLCDDGGWHIVGPEEADGIGLGIDRRDGQPAPPNAGDLSARPPAGGPDLDRRAAHRGAVRVRGALAALGAAAARPRRASSASLRCCCSCRYCRRFWRRRVPTAGLATGADGLVVGGGSVAGGAVGAAVVAGGGACACDTPTPMTVVKQTAATTNRICIGLLLDGRLLVFRLPPRPVKGRRSAIASSGAPVRSPCVRRPSHIHSRTMHHPLVPRP